MSKDAVLIKKMMKITLILICMVHAGCISFRAPYARGKNAQTGIASWYGRDFHGRPTASGETYDMHKLSAAHKYAPLGSFAIVENLDNGKTVKVRINDRGPFVTGRIIDLSYRAAKVIDMVSTGTARVKVTFLGDYDPKTDNMKKKYFLQVASFREKPNALNLEREMLEIHRDTFIHSENSKGSPMHRVCIGPLYDASEMVRLRDDIRKMGHSPMLTLEKCQD